MEQTARRRLDLELRRLELRKQESAAKIVPYISFILTHVALVLFLLAAFFIDRLIPNPATSLVVKISLSVIAVLFLASEWAYAIMTSLRWKKNIIIFNELEREQRETEERERQRQYEREVSVEQLRNRALQNDLQRLRAREGQPNTGPREAGMFNSQPGMGRTPGASSPNARSVRPQSRPESWPYASR